MYSYAGITLIFFARLSIAQDKWKGYDQEGSASNILDTHCKNNPLKCLMENIELLSSKAKNYKRSPIFYKGRSLCTEGDYPCEMCTRSLNTEQTSLTDSEWKTLEQCMVDMKYDVIIKKNKNWPDFNVMEPKSDISSYTDLTGVNKIKRNTDDLCPDLMDKLHCFERYMSIWMHAVASQHKRNLFAPGKKRANLTPRKHASRLFSTRVDLCPPGTDRVQCFDKILSLFVSLKARSGYNRNRNRNTREEDVEIGDIERGIIRDLMEECQSENDKLDCYTRHLQALPETSEQEATELSSSSSGDQTMIVNKKRVKGLCPDEMGKVNCYEHYLRSLVHTSQENTRGSHEFIGRKAK